MLTFEVIQCGDALSRAFWRFFVRDMPTLHNGKLPLVRFPTAVPTRASGSMARSCVRDDSIRMLRDNECVVTG